MSQQYNRRFSLVVSNFGPNTQFSTSAQTVTQSSTGTTTTFADEGEGIEFGDQGLGGDSFKISFRIERGDWQSPNSCDVRIFNLAPNTVNKLFRPEFAWITIQAGYENNFGLIFRGEIKQTRIGRQDAKDTYVDITAADGDSAYNFSTVSATIAAGATPQNAVQAFLQSMSNYRISPGALPPLSTNGSYRGRVFYGMTRDEMRDFAAANDLVWSIQDGALTFIPKTSFLGGEAIVISPDTDLIGVPEQIQNGVEIRVLLNPQIKIGQLVKLNSIVNMERIGLDIESQANNFKRLLSTNPNADGLYYVMAVNHTGDSRGNDWYSDLTCLSVDARVIPSGIVSQAVAIPANVIRRF